MTAGQKLTLLGFLLWLPSCLVLQLSAPIVPYMDALEVPANAERIVQFGYNPWDADAMGIYSPATQTPGLELFFASLALASDVRPVALAETAAMVPLAGLLMLATWRLGKATIGDIGGGIAALLLPMTPLLRREMHSAVLAIIPCSIALAWLIDADKT